MTVKVPPPLAIVWLFGPPATIAMVSSNLLIYWFADEYPKYRTGLLGIFNGVKLICVGNNIGLGVSIRF